MRRHQITHRANRFITQVEFYGEGGHSWQTWRLIPVKIGGATALWQLLSRTLNSGSLNEQGKMILLPFLLGFFAFFVTFAFIL